MSRPFERTYNKYVEKCKVLNQVPEFTTYESWLYDHLGFIYHEINVLRGYVRRYEPNANVLTRTAPLLESLSDEQKRMIWERENEQDQRAETGNSTESKVSTG